MILDDLGAAHLLEALPDPAIVIDSDGWILAGNAAANALLATAATPAGGNIVDFLPEQERSRLNPLIWLRRWAEQPQAPELAHVRLWCRDRAGCDKPVRVRVGVLTADPPAYLVMLVDVTAEQAHQHRTRSAHRLAARVLAISADAIVNVDESLTIAFANPSADALFGYSPGALVGEPLAILLPERHRGQHEAFMRAFAGEPAPSRLMSERAEVRGLTRSGEELPLEVSITKVTMDRGRMFSALLRDLRPRRAAEAEVRRSEARLRTVFEHAHQAMALVSPEGRVEAINAAGRRLLPEHVAAPGEAFAALPFFSSDPAGTATALGRALDQALGGERYQAGVTVRLPDGEARRLDFTLSPVHCGDGVIAVVAEAHDVTREPG